MPKIYKRNCNYCKKYYKGTGKFFCSRSCKGKADGFQKGHPFYKGAEKGWIKKGQHLSPNTEFKKGINMSGKNNPIFGKKLSEEHKKKIGEGVSRALKGKYIGEKSWNWKGGISFEPYSIDWTKTLKKQIRERDKYICQLCGKYGNVVHHVDYNKLNCNPDNLITLCKSCNPKVNFNRDEWIFFFIDKVTKGKLPYLNWNKLFNNLMISH